MSEPPDPKAQNLLGKHAEDGHKYQAEPEDTEREQSAREVCVLIRKVDPRYARGNDGVECEESQ